MASCVLRSKQMHVGVSGCYLLERAICVGDVYGLASIGFV